MQFEISKTGTISECRSALSEAVADRGDRSEQEQMIAKEIQYLVATSKIDPADAKHNVKNAALKAEGHEPEAEPIISFSVVCVIS